MNLRFLVTADAGNVTRNCNEHVAMPDLDRLENELDFRSVEMLRAIAENGSTATTSEIRDTTGLDNSQVRYRRRKLADVGLLEVSQPQSVGGGTLPPKEHTLTETGTEALSAGLYSRFQAPDPETFDELVEEVTRLRSYVNTLRDDLDGLEEQFESECDANRRRFKSVNEAFKEMRADLEEVDESVEELQQGNKGWL